MLIELIRKLIKTCGKSRYQISKDTGIEQAILSKIMSKERKRCNTETADILLKYFGYEVVKKHKAKTKGR